MPRPYLDKTGKFPDYYKELDLKQNVEATPDEIRKAYKHQILKRHPDKGGDSESFVSLKEAYDVLYLNPQEKMDYDIEWKKQNYGPTTDHPNHETQPSRSRHTDKETASSTRNSSTKTGRSKYETDSYKKGPSNTRPAPSNSHSAEHMSPSSGQYTYQTPYSFECDGFTGYRPAFPTTGYAASYATQPPKPKWAEDEPVSSTATFTTTTYSVKPSRSNEARKSHRRRSSFSGPAPSNDRFTESGPSPSGRHTRYPPHSATQTRPTEYRPTFSTRNEYVKTDPTFSRRPSVYKSCSPTGTPEFDYINPPRPQATNSGPHDADSIKSRYDSCPHHLFVELPPMEKTFASIDELRKNMAVIESNFKKVYEKMNPTGNNHGPRTEALCTSIYGKITGLLSDTRQTLSDEIMNNQYNTTICDRAEMHERLIRTIAMMKKWNHRVDALRRTLKDYEKPKRDSKERKDLQIKFVVLLAGWEIPERLLNG